MRLLASPLAIMLSTIPQPDKCLEQMLAPSRPWTSSQRSPLPQQPRMSSCFIGAATRTARQAAVHMGAQSADDESGSLMRPINRYVELIQNISAPELIKGFADTAPEEVQQAVRSTVVSLLGNLPPHLYDTNVMSTGQNVASLMYSMQMTGYMVRTCSRRTSPDLEVTPSRMC